MTEELAISLVREEIETAVKKWPKWPTDPVHAAAVVAEESGELVQAALQFSYEQGEREAMGREAIQVAAMAIRFLVSFARYEPTQAKNHKQD